MSATTTAPKFQVGDKVHFSGWSDVYPGTVVKVTAKRVVVRKDKFHRDHEWTPDFQVGGFVGHVSNNMQQKNIIEEDPTGALITFSLVAAPKHIREYHANEELELRWVGVGGSWQRGPFLRAGWSAHYDYNF